VSRIVVPEDNVAEACLVKAAEVYSAASLRDAVEFLSAEELHPKKAKRGRPRPSVALDLSDVKGQRHAKRALEVAAAGGHNLLLSGPPGAGKSLLAMRLPSILPPLLPAEALEVTKIHSVAGLLDDGALVEAPPFRSPHHTLSTASMVGGGSWLMPGEAGYNQRHCVRDSNDSRLARDPVIWCGVLAYALVVGPFLVPGLSRESLAWWTELYATILVMAVVVASLELGSKGRLPRSAKLFRHILAAAFCILLMKDLLYLMLPEDVFWENVYAGTYGYAYVFYYFVAFAVFAVVPHRHDLDVERAWLWLTRPLGALLLLLGLVVYFLGIPFANYIVREPAAKSHYIFGYVVLDVALLALVLRLRQSTESGLWRSVYGWFAVAFALGLPWAHSIC